MGRSAKPAASGGGSGADVTSHIRAVNPELATLVEKAKTVLALCGGKVDSKRAGRAKTFQEKRDVLMARIHELENLVEMRDKPGLNRTDIIRFRMRVFKESKDITGELSDLMKFHLKDMERRGRRMTAQEASDREQMLKQLEAEFAAVNRKAAGQDHGGADKERSPEGAVLQVSADEFASGGPLGAAAAAAAGGGHNEFADAGGVRLEQERLDAGHHQQLAQIRRHKQEQDQMLDQVGELMTTIKAMAVQVGEELQHQDQLIDQLGKEVEKNQQKLDGVNDRLDRALDMANSKSTMCCTYIICLVILLGVLMVGFNVMKKD